MEDSIEENSIEIDFFSKIFPSEKNIINFVEMVFGSKDEPYLPIFWIGIESSGKTTTRRVVEYIVGSDINFYEKLNPEQLRFYLEVPSFNKKTIFICEKIPEILDKNYENIIYFESLFSENPPKTKMEQFHKKHFKKDKDFWMKIPKISKEMFLK